MIGTDSGRVVGLLLMLFGLAGGIAYEVLDWRSGPAVLSVSPNRSSLAQVVQTTAVAPPNRVSAWRNEILSRPLFNRDRRPTERAAQSVSGLSRLTGIIFTGTRKVAIFAGPSGGHPIVAEEGSHVGAYDVRAISDSSVTVAGPEGTTVIRPIFGPPAPAGPNPITAGRPQPPVRPATVPQKP